VTSVALSKEQRDAAKAPAEHVMIVAPPGCGKTEVLAHRAEHLIPLLGSNQRILALTFTNRAKANLQERLRNVLGYARMRRHVTVRNFHGHATQVVLAHGRTIGLDPEALRLPKTSTLRKALEATGADWETRSAAENLLGEVKRLPLTDAEVLAALLKRATDAGGRVAHEVETERQAGNQLHYEDLLRHAQCLLRVPAVGHLYRCHFGAVLVDEFQDLSLQQLEILRLSCAARQTYAGDPLQGIFSWAGAAPVEVEHEVLSSCGQPILLRESHRSSPGVLTTVNSMSAALGAEVELVSAQPERWQGGGCSAALVLRDRAHEAQIVSTLARMICAQDRHMSVGIISRAAWRREAIDEVLVGAEDLAVRKWDLPLDDPRVVDLIQETVSALPSGATVEHAHKAVLDAVDPSDVETLEQVDDAFQGLRQAEHRTARAALRSIRVSDPKQAVGPGVHLLNAHTGKGQQFDWVFVVGLEEGHVPGRKSNTGLALLEEQRVLLVMLSRARHGLVVTRVQTSDGPCGPYEPRRSRWCSALRYDIASYEGVERHVMGSTGAVDADPPTS